MERVQFIKDRDNECIKALTAFVCRVANDKNATPAELAALPAIASLILLRL